jgi:hypothetical protein
MKNPILTIAVFIFFFVIGGLVVTLFRLFFRGNDLPEFEDVMKIDAMTDFWNYNCEMEDGAFFALAEDMYGWDESDWDRWMDITNEEETV